MNESFEHKQNNFKYPDIFSESGEFERVAKEFGVELSVLEYQAQNGDLVDLDDSIWSALENTDSFEITKDDWERVEELSSQVDRDWRDLKNKLQQRSTLQAPIIMKFGDKYHLVAGNTRLMVAKAMGVTPKVLVFEIDYSL